MLCQNTSFSEGSRSFMCSIPVTGSGFSSCSSGLERDTRSLTQLAIQSVALLCPHAGAHLHEVDIQTIEEARKMARRTQQVLHERSASGTQLHQLHLLRLSELLPLRHTPNTQKLSKNLVDLGGCNEMRLLLADDVAIVVKPKRRVRQR